MDIFIVDGQGITPDGQNGYAHDRVLYSLVRFGHRVSAATVHLVKGQKAGAVRCLVEVNLDCSRVISVDRTANSVEEAVNSAVEAAETRVGRYVDWRGLLNVESLATAAVWVKQFWRRSMPTSLSAFTR